MCERNGGSRSFFKVRGSLFLLALFILVGGSFQALSDNRKEVSRIFTVRPGPWTHTGIQLKKDDHLSVTAKGALKFPKDMWGGHTTGPDGFYELGFTSWNLKGKVGDNGRIQELGEWGSILADQDGELLLAPTHTYEPDPAAGAKISGSFTVTVTGRLGPGPLENPLVAGLVAGAVSAFVNSALVFQKPSRKPSDKKDRDDEANYILDVRTENERLYLVADEKDRLWIYAQITCDKPSVNTQALTQDIAFRFEGDYAEWMHILSTTFVDGRKSVLIAAKPPSEGAGVREGASVRLIVVGHTEDGEEILAPASLELLGELKLDLDVLG